MKSKDVTDSFKELGLDKKNGASVDSEEFELFMNHMTKTHQIKSMESYLNGAVKISSVSDTKAKRSEAKKTAEADVKSAEKPKAETKPTEDKKAPAAEIKNDTAVKKVAPEEKKPEIAKATEAAKAPQRQAPAAQGTADGGYRRNAPEQEARRPWQQGQQSRDQRGGYNRDGADRSRTDKGREQPRFRKYESAPSLDPFAKRRDTLNKEAQGFRRDGSRPAVNNGNAQRPIPAKATEIKPQTQPAVAASAKPTETVLPAQKAQFEKQQKQAQSQQKQQAQPQKPKQEEKRAQKQQFKTITPSVDTKNVKGGVNIGGEYSGGAAPSKTRVVDTRSSDVNLSKYDEKYNEQFYAISNGTDSKSSKQKLKKQDTRGQNQKSAKDKERAAQEKLKRLEAERARNKQLEITVPDEITVTELASRLKKTSAEVIKKLMLMGEMKGLNDTVDFATAEIIADEFGAKVTKEIVVTIEEKLFTEAEDSDEDLVPRAPVVCVMGHVDHGKTSILDAIRHTNVTKGEAGGITQAIGAYRVKSNGQDITFLDTPGHEAFTAMRMRGARSTDIAILVVAADDGIMPQTVEAINHAKAAGIDIIVAINKMDKPQANPDNVLNQLTQHELVPEEWGGDVICVPVSALTGMGIDNLLENVLLVAEMKELKANPKKRARGIVIESKLDKGRGPVATVLVQNGTLKQGDYVIVGNAVGRVRAMVDDKGKNVKSAGPSVPVEIIGLDDVPQAGDELNAVEDERMARSLAEQRREKLRQEILAANARVNLDELFSQIADGVKTLNIIVKADVAGSAEAVKASLVKLSNEEVKVAVIHSAVGGITESDVMLAAASNAIIVGFSVRPDKSALDSAERNNVDIRCHRIIYEIIDEVEAAMKGMLAPTFKEVLLGHAEVRQTIRVPGVGIIAGCYIQDGKITRQSQIRIVRDGIVIFEDKISSLRRFKDDVKEVAEGYECGVGIEKFNDIKEGDTLEAFIMEEVEK